MNIEHVKAILFDLDGVITDTDNLHFKVWKKVLKDYGIDVTKDMYLTHLQSRSHKESINALLGDVTDEKVKNISDYKNALSKEELKRKIVVYKDTISLIKALYKKGKILAVVSASSNAEFVINEINMQSYFDLIVSGPKGLGLRNKPHPDVYLHAMKELNVDPKDTLIIEDSLSGIEAGLKSGAFVIGVKREEIEMNQHDRLRLVNSLDDLF